MNVNFDEIDVLNTDEGGGNIYYHNGQPLTGIIVEQHSNSMLAYEKTVFNGYTHGRVASYFENGQIEMEFFEKYNQLYGIFKKWDINGNIIKQEDCGPEPQ